MTPLVPSLLLSPERAAHLEAGCAAAAKVVSAVMPPRPEDPEGALTLHTAGILATTALRDALRERAGQPRERQWWLDGFVVGHCVETVEALIRVQALGGPDPMTHLDAMAEAVLPRLETDQADAATVVFEVCRTIRDHDPVGLVWALEGLWAPVEETGVEALMGRVQSVVTAAIHTTLAAWLLLLLERDDRD